jgi:hypothetical protein
MLRRIVIAALALSLIAALFAVPAHAGRATAGLPDVTSLAAIVFPGADHAPASFGVYLGHGLALTNWHPWTLDGQSYTAEESPLSPSRQVPRYDDDGVVDPGERLLSMADCGGTWTARVGAAPSCVPFARTDGAGFIFPLAEDQPESVPVPVERLVYASRRYDIALFAVDAGVVEARGVRPARLSMVLTRADQPVSVAYQVPDQPAAVVPATLQGGAPALLPSADAFTLGGPWRVPSLVMEVSDPLPGGSPVFDQASGDLVGLAWRSGDDPSQTWVTPATVWFHDLYAANDAIQSDALVAVLHDSAVGPVDGPPTLDDPLAPGLGNGGIDVEHYALDLDFDMRQKTISGTATLAIRATYHKLRRFSLDAYGLQVDQVTIDGAAVSFATGEQKLVIALPEPMDYGTRFKVAIRYHATPQPYRSRYLPYFGLGMVFQDGRVSVLNEPDAAHSWFPCNDHPADRATYDFYLRVPAPLDAVANGHLLGTTPHEDGTQTFHWQIAYPLATYLIAVAVADYAAIDDQAPDGIPLRHYVYPDKVEAGREAFRTTGEALAQLEALFGPYPYDTYGHVVVPRGGLALETETITTMPDSLLGSAGSDVAPLIVHELAHQWFGDTVTVGTWIDIWLNEGFATYAEWLDDEFGSGPDAAQAARTVSEQRLISGSRATPLMAPAAAELFDTTSYEKGAWLLDMLRRQIGDEAFFKLLRAYAATFRDRPADSLDFWQLAEEVSGQDLGWFFEQWLMQGDLPRYTLYWSGRDLGADVLLCAAQPEQYRLDLPLRFRSQSHAGDAVLTVDGAEARASFPLDFMPAEVIPDPDQTVLAQVQVQPIAALPDRCSAAMKQ